MVSEILNVYSLTLTQRTTSISVSESVILCFLVLTLNTNPNLLVSAKLGQAQGLEPLSFSDEDQMRHSHMAPSHEYGYHVLRFLPP